jgi:hypothetical protein
MNKPPQSNGKLVWQECLSPEEIAEWTKSKKQPRKFWRDGGVSHAGVYRFIFPEDKSCYIGVAGHFGRRLRDHICLRISQNSEGPTKKCMDALFAVRSRIRSGNAIFSD